MEKKYKKYFKNKILIFSFAVITVLTLSGCGTTTPNYRVDLEI